MKKGFEISYALFRVAGTLKKKSFEDALESHALALLSSTTGGNYEDAQRELRVLENMIHLGAEFNLVSFGNSELMLSEMRALNAAIAEYGNAAKLPDLDLKLEEVFKKEEIMQPLFEDKIDERTEGQSLHRNAAIGHAAEMRQSAILEKIREVEKCRLKDIQEFLPHMSERTIRYDLQGLVERELIERIGPGGPATFYKVKREEVAVEHLGQNSFAADL
ncbi:MAG: DeoR family transcriptional regulator [Patescibacteria group bacterium]